jgi:DHA2 family multidrug resistance protein
MLNPDNPLGAVLMNGEVTRQAAMIAYDTVFAYMMFMVIAMVPLLLVLRRPRRMVSAPLEAME